MILLQILLLERMVKVPQVPIGIQTRLTLVTVLAQPTFWQTRCVAVSVSPAGTAPLYPPCLPVTRYQAKGVFGELERGGIACSRVGQMWRVFK